MLASKWQHTTIKEHIDTNDKNGRTHAIAYNTVVSRKFPKKKPPYFLSVSMKVKEYVIYLR